MTYRAVVESQRGKSYRATVLGWPECTVDAATREEALTRLREALRQRLTEVEIVPLDIDLPENANPWLRFAAGRGARRLARPRNREAEAEG